MDVGLVESFVASWERIVAEASSSEMDGLVYGKKVLTEEGILVLAGGRVSLKFK
jgi:alkylated DNA nucleotide flippase Atl1